MSSSEMKEFCASWICKRIRRRGLARILEKQNWLQSRCTVSAHQSLVGFAFNDSTEAPEAQASCLSDLFPRDRNRTYSNRIPYFRHNQIPGAHRSVPVVRRLLQQNRLRNEAA